MQWLTLIFALQAGMVSHSVWIAPEGRQPIGWAAPSSAFALSMETTFTLFDHVELYGMMRSYQTPDTLTSWRPFAMDYGIGAAATLGPFKAGVYHECDHSIKLAGISAPPGNGYGEGGKQFFIRFEH